MPHDQPIKAIPPRSEKLDCVLGLRTRAAAVCAIRVTGELDSLSSRKLQDLLELLANVHENLLALLRRSTLTSCNVAISAAGDALADCSSPDTNTVEAFSDVNNYTHKFPVIFILECLANCRKHDMEPEFVDRDAALVLELVRPLPAVLILGILPFWSDAFLEQVVIGFEGEF
jgi:hypothetical protein